MSVSTLPATLITSTTARLNGQSFNYDAQCGFVWWHEGDPENIVDTGLQEWIYYYDLSGLTTGERYYYYAYTDADGGSVGDTLGFRATLIKNLSGALTPSGSMDIHISTLHKALAGSLTPSGTLTTIRSANVGGSLTPSGTLLTKRLNKQIGGSLIPFGTLLIQKNAGAVQVNLDGALTPSGSLRAFKNVVNLGGSLTPSGTVTAVYIGDYAMAAKENLYLEQGATYVKEFEWQNSSGVAKDLSIYTFRAAIKPYKGGTVIASTFLGTMAVTKLGTTGHFKLTMNATITASFTFDRAVYDIEAVSGATVIRVVEGFVYLSKEVTTNAT